MSLKKLFLYVISLLLFCHQAVAATVTDIRFSNFNTGVLRVVVETDKKVDVSVIALHNPERLALDFPDSVISSKVQKKSFATNKLVSGVRFGRPRANVARVVLDLKNEVKAEHFLLPPQLENGIWRFVADLSVVNTQKSSGVPLMKQSGGSSPIKPMYAPQSATKTASNAASSAKSVVKKTNQKSLQPFKKQKHIVMLDPGHGGKDPGAISKNGHYEKDLTLKMGKETRTLLEKAGYKVVMTRDTDVYISLRGRVRKAHAAKADLFISIHADSSTNTSAKGLSIYTLSETASDREAAALAERENKSDILFEMDLGDVNQDASKVLIDLAQTETIGNSRRYADFVETEMRKTVQTVPKPNKHAGFAVLKSPSVPAVLLEMGYLSNRNEEAQLQKAAYRKKLSEALVRAVNKYFDEYDKAFVD